ncbi:hypothetical protein [Rhizobium sp. G21]|uniref:hypothetical protein n=1 Tax=Rhizobium sp. G21 TaxID=2758439 RepID=UPI00160464E1|nr:hypothetical protein [Rhizobium sp. G21]MBB1251645.1 hypothetical protein [Rhizobium sp. G21]
MANRLAVAQSIIAIDKRQIAAPGPLRLYKAGILNFCVQRLAVERFRSTMRLNLLDERLQLACRKIGIVDICRKPIFGAARLSDPVMAHRSAV